MDDRDSLISEIAQHLDISPTDFRRAQERFNAVKHWLEGGSYQSGSSPDIYLQGSFRLGTVVRPFRGDSDRDFDIDQVCELSTVHQRKSAGMLKAEVGERLKENSDYRRILDEEGKRCWTLEYASDQNRPGFHIDILPSIPSASGNQFQIDITNKEGVNYKWTSSNSKGYYYWFKSKNVIHKERIDAQRLGIFESNREIYESPDDVPRQLFRSPLQRAIQIIKRHRDVYFAGQDYRPISIIITTIATHVHSASTIVGVIDEFCAYIIKRHYDVLSGGVWSVDNILDFVGGEWRVPNPVHLNNPPNEVENFADRWNEDISRSSSFFAWVYQLERDVARFRISGSSDDLALRVKQFGNATGYASIVRKEVDSKLEQGVSSTNTLLELIHLAIEGKIDWKFVEKVARHLFERAVNDEMRDIAKVNFYQIARHQGRRLSVEAQNDVQALLRDHKGSPAFEMCCNLLLDRATGEMIRSSVQDESGFVDELRWPILRLANSDLLLPAAART